jgi:hypothetical protein
VTIFLFVAFSVEVSVRFPGEANEGGQHVVRNFVVRNFWGLQKLRLTVRDRSIEATERC